MRIPLSCLPLALAMCQCIAATVVPLPRDVGSPKRLAGRGCSPSIDVNNATAFALMYGYPLTLYVQTFEPILQSVGTNAPVSEQHTATATSEVLVRPNVDTLYTRFAIDLSHSDVVISVPKVPDDRFFVVPFYDLYGNNFANLGSATDSPAGDYLLTVAGDDEPGLSMASGYSHSAYKGIVKYPTTYGSIMARVVVKNNGTDLDAVHAIQAQFKMKTKKRQGKPLAPALTPAVLGNGQLSEAALLLPFNFTTAQTTATLKLLAQLHSNNLPEDKSDRAHVNSLLTAAGIKDGKYTPPSGINYDQVSTLVAGQFEALQTPSNHGFEQNGWFDLLPSLSGDFHTHYTARAYIAWFGYLQLVEAEAMYPTYHDPTLAKAQGTMQLASNQSYIMTFSAKPPVTGFWSITAYNSTNYLVPNSLDRYSLGDRSNLTYADGTQVYADSGSNGAFSILIQPADAVPSSNWTNNWLPAPAGEGVFTVNLRWYGPTDALLNATYAYPIVTKQGTIH